MLHALVRETRRRYGFIRNFMRFFANFVIDVSMRFRFMRWRFMLSKTRRVARRDFNIMRMRLRSRRRNIRRASLPELRQRLSRQQSRDVSLRRSRLARLILGWP